MGDACRTSGVDSIESPRAQSAARRRLQLFRSRSTILLAVAFAISTVTAASAQPAAGGPPADPPPAADPGHGADQQGGGAATPSSPLAIHVGDSDFLIGGFLDATAIMRSTNPGTGIGTSFGTIPFTTTATGAPNPAGNLSETRFSAQNSRLSLQATSKVGQASLKGYLEADFLGNTATNLNVTSNANTLRMRLYWAQFITGKFEFLAGQTWSMMTPNRTGLSPVPGDIFYTQVVDTNYQNGLPWGREMGFRFIAHASNALTAGVALENPEQYVGSSVVLPALFPASEVDTGAGNLGSASPVPNPYPDIIGKIAWDPKSEKTHQHIDAGFIIRGYKTFNPVDSSTATATGTAGSINAVIEPMANFRLVATNFFGNGGGRYIANANIPDFIVTGNQQLSLVKSWSGIYGAEDTIKKSLVYGYYSVVRAAKNVTLDANGKTPIGFGIDGSQSANEKINELTVGLTQTLFRDPKIGGMQVMVQYSYLERFPFSPPVNTPTSAKLNMVYVNVRYILP
jgi:hypothetical protein